VRALISGVVVLLLGLGLFWTQWNEATSACTGLGFLDGEGVAVDDTPSLFPPGYVCHTHRLADSDFTVRLSLWRPGRASSHASRLSIDYPQLGCNAITSQPRHEVIVESAPRYASNQEAASSLLDDLVSGDDTIVDLGFDGLDSHLFALERDSQLLATVTVTRLSDFEWIAFDLNKC